MAEEQKDKLNQNWMLAAVTAASMLRLGHSVKSATKAYYDAIAQYGKLGDQAGRILYASAQANLHDSNRGKGYHSVIEEMRTAMAILEPELVRSMPKPKGSGVKSFEKKIETQQTTQKAVSVGV